MRVVSSRAIVIMVAFACWSAFLSGPASAATAAGTGKTAPASPVGTWAGTSTCAGNRPACKNENVVYRFAPIEGQPHQVRLFGDKVLEGKRVPMGALDFEVNEETGALRCEFRRAQTHGVWSFQISGDTMTGSLVILPEGSKARDVRVRRVNEADVPDAPAEAEYEEPAAAPAPSKPTTGYAPVNGLKMYYEVHGSGDPVVLLHGSFMTITNNWTGWIGELSKTRQVIAVEMQGHGRTADINREFSYDSLADDVAALLDHLKVASADLIGYSMGGSVALQCAIRHPDKVRKVVSISAVFRHDGWVKEALDAYPHITAEALKGSSIETEYKKLSPTPEEFPNFVRRAIAMDLKPYDFGADKLKATRAPMFFIHGDADGVRLDHIAEMFRLKGDEIMGDMRPRSASRLAVLPNTTHLALIERMPVIVPMVNEFLDAQPR